MKHKKKKRIAWGISLFLLVCVIGGCAGILRFFPDAVYGFSQMIEKRQQAELQEISVETDVIPTAQLSSQSTEDVPILTLIDPEHPVPSDSAPFVPFRDTELLLREEVIPSLERLLSDAKEQTGEKLLIMSSYRTSEEQQELYEEDPSTASRPGSSEHESGLALDLYVYQYAGKNFIKTDAGRWVNEHCQDYGFVIRYPFGKKSVTGFSYEPWHIRYVGTPHAEIMYQNHWTLEEYLKQLTPGVFYQYEDYLISRQQEADGCLQIPKDSTNVCVGSDNTGFYVVTAQMI